MDVNCALYVLHVAFRIMSHSILCRIQGYVVWYYVVGHYVAFGVMSFGIMSHSDLCRWGLCRLA